MTTYRSLFSLLTSYGILLLANGLFGTLIALRTKSEAFPEVVIGVVLAGYFAGLLISAFYAARVVARIGHIRAFATFASVASAVAIAHLLWVDPLFWGILRVLSGFCMGGMIVVTEGWLHKSANNQNRGSILSLYMITTYACIGVTQLLLMLGDPDGFRLFVVVSILYSMALIPILLSQTNPQQPVQASRPNIKQLYQTSPVGMLGAFVVGILNGIFYAMTPIYAKSMGLSTEQTAIFIALCIASGMLLQLPLGRLSDRVDRRWVIVFSASMTVLACICLFYADASQPMRLYMAGIFYGSVAFTINPLCAAHVNDLSPKNERTQTASGLLMFFGIGAVLGPLLAGFILPLGARYIYLLSAVVAFLFCIYALWRLLAKPRHNQVKDSFKPYTAQSPARRLSFDNNNEKK